MVVCIDPGLNINRRYKKTTSGPVVISPLVFIMGYNNRLVSTWHSHYNIRTKTTIFLRTTAFILCLLFYQLHFPASFKTARFRAWLKITKSDSYYCWKIRKSMYSLKLNTKAGWAFYKYAEGALRESPNPLSNVRRHKSFTANNPRQWTLYSGECTDESHRGSLYVATSENLWLADVTQGRHNQRAGSWICEHRSFVQGNRVSRQEWGIFQHFHHLE